MSDDSFSPMNDQQGYANCGPTSMSYCLFMLFGNDINQHDVASVLYKGPKKWYKTTYGGFDQDELRKAAGKFGAKTEFLQEFGEENFEKFNKRLVAHLKTGNPAMLAIYDSEHWVAISGYEEKRQGGAIYYVNDPQEGGDRVFDEWGKSGVKEEIDDDTDDYFAILLKRKDGEKPVFPLSKGLRNLLDNGSLDTMPEMRRDLETIASKASAGKKRSSYMSDHLITHKDTILKVLDNLLDWDSAECDLKEIKEFYDDYLTVARAARIKAAAEIDTVLFTAYMTCLLTTCAWWGEL